MAEGDSGDRVRKRGSIITTIYVPPDKLAIMEGIEKIARREYSNISPIIVKAMEEYVKAHAEGNTTFQLEKWTEEPQFTVTPALMVDDAKWVEYSRSCAPEERRKLLFKAQRIAQLMKAMNDWEAKGNDVSKYYPGK